MRQLRRILDNFSRDKIIDSRYRKKLSKQLSDDQIKFNYKLQEKIKNKARINYTGFFFRDKQISKEQIDSFFKKYLKQRFNLFKSNKSIIDKHYNIRVFKLTPSTLATVRVFNKHDLYQHLKKYTDILNYSKNKKFNNFIFYPVEILDIKKINKNKYGLIEKVYPIPNLTNLLYYSINRSIESSYSKSKYDYAMKNIFEKTNLSSNLFYEKLYNSYLEFSNEFYKKIDVNMNNILILGYDKKENKFIFGPIDFYKTESKSF